MAYDEAEVARVNRFLSLIWGNQVGWVFAPWRNTHWHEGGFQHGPEARTDLAYGAMHTADQYFCPLVFRHNQRKAEYALPTHVLWADLDAADPRGVRLRPSCAWETSQGGIPHYQALWFLDQQISAQEAAQLSKRIAYAEPGCDRSGWDVTQVLRLPGTLNHKYDPPAQVRFLWATKHAYTLAGVIHAYPQGPLTAQKTWTDGEVLTFAKNNHEHWGWLTRDDLYRIQASLPVGLQYELERPYDGRDRSAWLFTTASHLLGASVPPAVVVELLRRTAMNKFAGRSDETTRLRETVAQAMAKRGEHDNRDD